MVWAIHRDYGVRWWWWWDARTRKMGGGRGQTENRGHTLAGSSKVLGRRLIQRVHSRVDIVVEVVGCYIGGNEQPAVNLINELMKKKKKRTAACIPGALSSTLHNLPLLLYSPGPTQSRHSSWLGLHDVEPHRAG